MVPDAIRFLAKEALSPIAKWPPTSSPSIAREVIADWCEENDLLAYARYLRPMPPGSSEATWRALRKAILRWLAGEIEETDDPFKDFRQGV